MSKESFYVSIFRNIRTLVYWGIEPFDKIFRFINGIPQYPPIPYRRHAGGLGAIDGPGYEFAAYFKLLLKIKQSHRVWDIGCGCGLLELALESLGWRGIIVGTDIHKPSIEWAQRTLGSREKTFKFLHSDIYNMAYWPEGKLNASEWLNGFEEKNFDIIIAKSLFTHVLPFELDIYLEHIAKRLVGNGRCLLTFFILNEAQQNYEKKGLCRIKFKKSDGIDEYAVRRLDAPTAAVAYEEKYLQNKIKKYGLEICGCIYSGIWSGNPDGLSYQDLVILQKKSFRL